MTCLSFKTFSAKVIHEELKPLMEILNPDNGVIQIPSLTLLPVQTTIGKAVQQESINVI
jgi:hypothetical protein